MGSLELALNLTRDIKNEILKSITLARISCVVDSDEILKEALNVAKKLDLLHYSEALSKIAVELAKTGKFDFAIKLAYDVVEERFRLEALETIAFTLIDAGEFEKAFEIAVNLKYRSQRALSYLAVNMAAFNEKEVKKVVEKITDAGWKAETLAKIASLSLKNRDKLFEEALKITNEIKDEAIRSRIFLKIAVEMAKSGMEFEDVLMKGLVIESNDIDLLNTSLSLAKIGHIEFALKTVESIKKMYVKAEALAKIARISRIDLFEKALEVAKSIKNKQIYVDVLFTIVLELARSKLNYSKFLSEATKEIQSLDDFESSKILTSFIVDFVEIDIDKAVELSNKIADDVYRSEALFYIAKKLASIGEFNKALKIADTISEEYWKSKALGEIAVKIVSCPSS